MKLAGTLTSLALASLLALAAPLAASATEQPDPQIAAALEAVPGGELIDAHTAYWPEQEMTLTIVDPRLREAVGSCPNGSICVYSGSGLSGSRLSWTTCGTHATSPLGAAVRSIADARSTGTLQARNGTTVVATATAQSWNNVATSSDNVNCT